MLERDLMALKALGSNPSALPACAGGMWPRTSPDHGLGALSSTPRALVQLPALSGEKRLPNFMGAAVLRATNGHRNLLQFFVPGPGLLHLHCLCLGLPGELRAGLFGVGRLPETL